MNSSNTYNANFIALLKCRLLDPLPGDKAHLTLEPETRKKFKFQFNHTSPARESAVLILLFPENDGIATVLIKRNEYEGIHSGQVAFPGGKKEDQDNSDYDIALREAHEEIGILKYDVEILGKLSKIYIPPSNYNVQPIVGWISYKPNFVRQQSEVALIFNVAIHELLNPHNLQTKTIVLNDGISINVPCYYLKEQIVWGATSMILSEFIEILKDISN
ncbi:MAG: CoA pyrophosphatase [Bacteroidetes bacterium HGW-Bacteroidetes-1]|jgi:8-oxo-dGTP pyrophosphatase MutT (NUDIX family)|nr:MAG: CoA pyrophosphatase [Bacteroidetes bacterium HGW-Bacteroidetes-1]